MSIDKVEVTNSQGNLLTLSMEDISNGYIIEDIGGLGPVKATIVSSSFATMDGQQEQASSRDIRNITIQLGYVPDFTIDQTVRTLRSRLYQFFMTKMKINLVFYMTDGLVVEIEGRVETCEPAIFTREPQMDISIVCFNPDLVDPTPVSMHDVFTTTDTEGSPVVVAGSVETGLTSLTFTAPIALPDGFTIYHTTPAGDLRTMVVSAPLELNDVVNICTIKGQKSITVTRTGTTSSLMYAVSPLSTWVLLEPGENQLYLSASETDPAPVLIDFHNRYGGL